LTKIIQPKCRIKTTISRKEITVVSSSERERNQRKRACTEKASEGKLTNKKQRHLEGYKKITRDLKTERRKRSRTQRKRLERDFKPKLYDTNFNNTTTLS